MAANKPFTVQIALSIGAEHTGTCSLKLYNSIGTKSITLAQDVDGCTNHPHSKSQDTKSLCPNSFPEGLVTDDMCTYPWTITVPDLSALDFTSGFLQWSWSATHVSPSEQYQNCADVSILAITTYPSTAVVANTLPTAVPVSYTLPDAIPTPSSVSNVPTASKFSITTPAATKPIVLGNRCSAGLYRRDHL